MTTIIRRDFFPGTAKLEAQLEYLEASETNDCDRLREISERYATTTHTPAPSTPSTFETPSSTPSTREKLKRAKDSNSDTGNPPPDAKKQKPEDSKSLDEFLFKYHSEDDASFDELLEKSEEERERKNAWLYHQEEEYQKPLPLMSGEEQLAITDGSASNSTSSEGGSGVKTWAYTAKNSLMYVPDSVEDSVKESLDKSVKRREIAHSNTRLSRKFILKTTAAFAKAASEGEAGGKNDREKVGVDGKLAAESETPRVNGYSFEATPQIHPGWYTLVGFSPQCEL